MRVSWIFGVKFISIFLGLLLCQLKAGAATGSAKALGLLFNCTELLSNVNPGFRDADYGGCVLGGGVYVPNGNVMSRSR